LYQFPNAFAPFAAANGVNIIVQRIKDEVEDCAVQSIVSHDSGVDHMEDVKLSSEIKKTEELSAERVVHLRGMMKFILHLMQTNGTSDGMRNLIDSSLPGSILQIFQSRKFGASIFGLGMNEKR
jgi:E3 ubiquitin-protein ligase HUWE1